jgi:hypothetical protein
MIDLIEKYIDHSDIGTCHNCIYMLQANQYTLTGNTSQDLVYKALTSLTIERTLLKIGKPVYDKVVLMLNKKYQCYIPDCYEHPEYLGEILKEVFGNSNVAIVKEIRKELHEFSHKDQITRFIELI